MTYRWCITKAATLEFMNMACNCQYKCLENLQLCTVVELLCHVSFALIRETTLEGGGTATRVASVESSRRADRDYLLHYSPVLPQRVLKLNVACVITFKHNTTTAVIVILSTPNIYHSNHRYHPIRTIKPPSLSDLYWLF